MNYGLVNNELAKEIAMDLLNIGAIVINQHEPFTWSSGWKSPIYCDNRITLSFPEIRSKISRAFANVIRANYRSTDAVSGVATAGIPQGALVADILSLPYSYVRSKPKGHGMENLIEGKVEEGQQIAVVEDLISTGGSSLKAVDALREAGADVTVLLSIFNYGFDLAETNCRNRNVDVIYLSDYETMLGEAVKLGVVKESELGSLRAWRSDPAHWS